MNPTELIAAARAYAAQKHAGQFRKGSAGAPYVDHVEEVAGMVRSATDGKDPEMIAAAYLHDVVEDSDATPETLKSMFGSGVAELVVELTDEPGLGEDARRQAQIDHAPCLTARAKIIKIADKISNLEELLRDPPAGWGREKQLAYLEWGEAVFDGLDGVKPDLDDRFRATAKQLREAIASR